MGIRDEQMAQRRDHILDTAEQLIRQTGGTDFSVRLLAKTANVAPATPFNLFGSKEGLLYALLSRTLDEIIRHGLVFEGSDPVNHVVKAATTAVDMFARDPALMRPLYQVLLGVNDPVQRPRFMHRSMGFWRTAIASLPREGQLSGEHQREALVGALQAQFLGLLEYWVYQEIDDTGFRDRAVFGLLATLSSALDQQARLAIAPLLRDTADRLAPLYPPRDG